MMEHADLPERDGDGYLTDMNAWNEVVGRGMAAADDIDLDDEKWEQILQARDYYATYSAVPPVRKFAKFLGVDTKSLFNTWMTGPMKPITKYGGLPKPTGCV